MSVYPIPTPALQSQTSHATFPLTGRELAVHAIAPGANSKARRRGFTLIEMLVVLLIMGLLVGLVSASAQPDEKALLRVEADRLAQLMDLAALQSRLSGRPVAWTSNGPAYRFWQFSEEQGWLAIADDVLRPRTLPQGMRISGMRVENIQAPGLMRVEFNSYGAAAAFSLELFFGSARFTVANSPIGEVRVVPQGGMGNETPAQR